MASRTAQYHSLHDTLIARGDVAVIASFNENFTPILVLDTADVEELEGGFKVWTEEELLYSVSDGLLKSVSDTQVTIEEDNIRGQNVTLVVSNGQIGATGGSVDININKLRLDPVSGTLTFQGGNQIAAANFIAAGFLVSDQVFVEGSGNSGPYVVTARSTTTLTVKNLDGTAVNWAAPGAADVDVSITLTDDERVTLAAAERTDVVYIKGTPPTSQVKFFDNGANPDTIQRIGLGLFNVSAGDFIQVSGNSANATEGSDQFYRVASATTTLITLDPGDSLNTEFGSIVEITNMILDPGSPIVTATFPSTVDVLFANNGNADTITRSGGWAGFQAGMFIAVIGSADNDTGTDLFYKIADVSGDVLTLTGTASLETTLVLETVSIEGGFRAVVDIGRINLIEDIDINATGVVNVTSSGEVFIGSESTIRVDTVLAGDDSTGAEVRIKVADSILDAGTGTNIRANDLILEAGDGEIGRDGAGDPHQPGWRRHLDGPSGGRHLHRRRR